MSKETREARRQALAAIDDKIAALQEQIDALEQEQWAIPELEEDRQWKRDHMLPWQQQMEALTLKLLASQERIISRGLFTASVVDGIPPGTAIGTTLRIRLPADQ